MFLERKLRLPTRSCSQRLTQDSNRRTRNASISRKYQLNHINTIIFLVCAFVLIPRNCYGYTFPQFLSPKQDLICLFPEHILQFLWERLLTYKLRSLLNVSSSSCAPLTLNPRTVGMRMILISINASSYPMQFRGPFSKSWKEFVSVFEKKTSRRKIGGIAIVVRITMDE